MSASAGEEDAAQGRLTFRQQTRPAPTKPGPSRRFRLDTEAGGFAVVQPPRQAGPVRLVVLLHGAGGHPEGSLPLLAPYVDEHRLLVATPRSRGRTWDVIAGGSGPDVRMVDEVLCRLTAAYPVEGCTVAGFSDGASYAATLGIANGDVFDSVIAFSPGFAAARVHHGQPRFFVSHGVDDRVLPIDRCSRRLVPKLQRSGYDVTYEEFDGEHEIPLDIRARAVGWLADPA
jgi:predicted esterase